MSKQLIETLLQNRIDINSKDWYGYTPLHITILNRGSIRSILQHGADVNDTYHDGSTPLHLAIQYGGDVESLLEYGARVNVKDRYGYTPLHLAIQYGREHKILLRYGANVNVQNKEGDTPLHLAVYLNSTTAIKDLINHGSDPYIRNVDNQNIFDIDPSFVDTIDPRSSYLRKMWNQSQVSDLQHISFDDPYTIAVIVYTNRFDILDKLKSFDIRKYIPKQHPMYKYFTNILSLRGLILSKWNADLELPRHIQT